MAISYWALPLDFSMKWNVTTLFALLFSTQPPRALGAAWEAGPAPLLLLGHGAGSTVICLPISQVPLPLIRCSGKASALRVSCAWLPAVPRIAAVVPYQGCGVARPAPGWLAVGPSSHPLCRDVPLLASCSCTWASFGDSSGAKPFQAKVSPKVWRTGCHQKSLSFPPLSVRLCGFHLMLCCSFPMWNCSGLGSDLILIGV